MSAKEHFLVWRDKDGLRKIEVFLDRSEAVAAYDFHEWRTFADSSIEVRLFSADSLATLCRAHASWLCPETLRDVLNAA